MRRPFAVALVILSGAAIASSPAAVTLPLAPGVGMEAHSASGPPESTAAGSRRRIFVSTGRYLPKGGSGRRYFAGLIAGLRLSAWLMLMASALEGGEELEAAKGRKRKKRHKRHAKRRHSR